MKKLIPAAAIAWALPLLAFAESATRVDSIGDAANVIIGLINNVLVPLVFAISFIVFIWGVFRFFIAGTEDEKAKDNAKHLMLYGIVGFFVMVSVWGLVYILIGTFNLENRLSPGDQPIVPGLRSPSGDED